MAVTYFVGLLAILGLVQGIPFSHQPAIIEQIRDGVSSRIVAGWEASEGQIPHQVSVRMVSPAGTVFSCGGSIIHHQWVITAAHCVANRILFIVRFGVIDLDRPELIVETERKYIYPEYNEAAAGVQTDDIALIGFDEPVPYGPNIQPCRLQNSETKNKDYTGIRFTVSGFGLTDDPWNGGVASNVLLWVFLRGISNEECLRWYPNSRIIQAQTICAASYNDTAQSACQGDSGGPLTIVDADGKPTMVGIVSFGSNAGCNSPWPGGYVRPGHYHNWYKEVTSLDFDWAQDDIEPEQPEEPESPEEPEEPESPEEPDSPEGESEESEESGENGESSESEESGENGESDESEEAGEPEEPEPEEPEPEEPEPEEPEPEEPEPEEPEPEEPEPEEPEPEEPEPEEPEAEEPEAEEPEA